MPKLLEHLIWVFFRPEKDQCSLCMTYKKGDASTKENVQELFDKHTQENIKVRSLKDICKSKANEDSNCKAAVFYLQQVIHLP